MIHSLVVVKMLDENDVQVAESVHDIMEWSDVLNVSPVGSESGHLVLTATHLIFTKNGRNESLCDESDIPYMLTPGKQSNDATGFMIALSLIDQIFPRCYRLSDCGFEIFGPKVGIYGVLSEFSIFLSFANNIQGEKLRNRVVLAIKDRAEHVKLKFWPFQSFRDSLVGLVRGDSLYKVTKLWRKRKINNYDYLMKLNAIAGRSKNDLSAYPVFPWVLSNYESSYLDLSDPSNYRDLTKPMGALDPDRLEKFKEKYKILKKEAERGDSTPPFMFGSHYSTKGGTVIHYLIRKRPFTGLHRNLQGGEFDLAPRIFDSIIRAWEKSSKESSGVVNELIPEFYSDPSFLRNDHGFDFGCVDGKDVSHVELPPWAKGSAETFINLMRDALESDICSEMLPHWIDLMFGYKQRGKEAKKANNVFHHLTYFGPNDMSGIKGSEKEIIILHIDDFGKCPDQIFTRAHPHKKSRDNVTSIDQEYSD